MEKKIAIRGHRTRGAEVIKVLEELGGKNNYFHGGRSERNIYFIDKNNEIDYIPLTVEDINKSYQIYTLEEYLYNKQNK